MAAAAEGWTFGDELQHLHANYEADRIDVPSGAGSSRRLPWGACGLCIREECLFYIQRATDAKQWRARPLSPLGHSFEGLALGLVDAPGDCQLPAQRTVNSRTVMAMLCVDHLLIAATPGLLQKYSDLRKATNQERVLPAWQPEALRRWCCGSCRLPEQEWEARVQLCGDAATRLVLGGTVPKEHDAWREGFDRTLNIFLTAILGSTPQGRDAAPREAHAMVVLQPSPELAEEAVEASTTAKPGEMLRYVSRHVQCEVHRALLARRLLPQLLRAIPQAGPYAFEELVLRGLTQGDGLDIDGRKLKMARESWLEDLLTAAREPDLGVLYRPRSRHFPSIDAYAVVRVEDVLTAYFLQVTTAKEHVRVQSKHVKTLRLAGARKIVCLYLLPAQQELTLKDGDAPLQHGSMLDKAKCVEVIVSAEALLAHLDDDVREILKGRADRMAEATQPAGEMVQAAQKRRA